MAVDEVLAASARRHGTPTLRMYRWNRRTLTVGSFQSLAMWDEPACRRDGVEVVRRITGGRAVLHGSDLTYSISAPAGLSVFPESLRATFHAISRGLVAGLISLGVDARAEPGPAGTPARGTPDCFASTSWYEITISGRKIIGSAQRRWADGFLQQGSIMLTADPTAVSNYLGCRGLESAPEAARSGLFDLVGRDWPIEVMYDAVAQGFRTALGLQFDRGALTPTETSQAEELVRTRYRNRDWTVTRATATQR